MLTLITGGCKCGKSSIAENILSDFCGRKIYIATMEPSARKLTLPSADTA